MHNLAIPAGLTLVLASTLSATAQQPPSTQPSAQGGSGPTIRLLNAGASPRTLRLAPRPGATGVIDLTMHIKAKKTVNGALTPEPPSPGVLMSFATTVTEIHGARIGYTFECIRGDLVEDAVIPPAALDLLRGGIKMVVGLRGTGGISDRGVSLGATVTTAPGMDAILLAHATAINNLLEQVSTPLPAEPVGVGGSWEITNTIDQDGLTLQETITCTLAASDGNTVEIVMVKAPHRNMGYSRNRPGRYQLVERTVDGICTIGDRRPNLSVTPVSGIISTSGLMTATWSYRQADTRTGRPIGGTNGPSNLSTCHPRRSQH